MQRNLDFVESASLDGLREKYPKLTRQVLPPEIHPLVLLSQRNGT